MNGMPPLTTANTVVGDLINPGEETIRAISLVNTHVFRMTNVTALITPDCFLLMVFPSGSESFLVIPYTKLKALKTDFFLTFKNIALTREKAIWSNIYPVTMSWLHMAFPGFLKREVHI